MSAMDPEDALDQLLNSTWSNMAQQLSMLHRSLSADIQQQHRERKAEQAQQARLQAAEIKEMEAQRARLLSWESAHRRELNNGFESVLNATVLGTRGCSPLSDTSLLKAWNVSEMLVGTDLLRRPAQPGAQPHGDGMVAAPSRRDHRTAGRPRHEQRHHHLRGPHARPRGHPGRVREGRLHRQTRPRRHLAGRVQGPARRRDVPCRPGERRGMERAAERPDRRMRDDAGRRVHRRGRPADQPPARRRTARILGRGQPQRGRRTVQPVRGLHERERERGPSLRPAGTVRIRHGGTRRSVFRGRSNGGWGKSGRRFGRTPAPEKRRKRAVESETGGDLSSSEATGKNETDLVDLYEPEEWDGPDLFGEYSPEQEARITPPAAPAMEPSLPDVPTVKQAGR